MFLINGLLRYVTILFSLLLFYVLAGGHVQLLWNPYAMGMVLVIYCSVYLFKIGFRPIDKNLPVTQIKSAAKAGLFLSIFAPLYLGLVHTTTHLDQDSGIVLHYFVGWTVHIFQSVLIYYAFFFPYFDEQNSLR